MHKAPRIRLNAKRYFSLCTIAKNLRGKWPVTWREARGTSKKKNPLLWCRSSIWKSKVILKHFFFSSFVSIQGCLYPNAAVHEPECLIFRRHQPKKLKVELDSTIPHPLYAIVVPLRLLALRNSNPAKWDLAQDLDSHLEERYNDAKFLFVIATAMPILRSCGVTEDDINLVQKILAIGWW